MKKKSSLILSIIGAIIGIIVVRMHFLDMMQIMGWKLFWNNLFSLDFDLIGRVFTSSTFWKCIFGGLIGGVAGAFIGKKISK